MFDKIFGNKKLATTANANTSVKPDSVHTFESKRQHRRRSGKACIALVNDQVFTVKDWSMGGFRLHGGEKTFSAGDSVDFVLKFTTDTGSVDVTHKATALHHIDGDMSFEFLPLGLRAKRDLQYVIEDSIMQEQLSELKTA